MYKVLDKNTIKEHILPHLSVGKRGFKVTSKLEEVVNAILYKMKTPVLCAFLAIKIIIL